MVKIHRAAVHLLALDGYNCLNDSNDLYRPHLTLARVRLPSSIESWPDSILSRPSDSFKLVLGEGDSNGQFLKTISLKDSRDQ